VHEGDKLIKLGQAVNGQQDSIDLPVVVGAPPGVAIQPWQSDGYQWPRRRPRDVKPWRTLLAGKGLRAGQVRVPDRIFPEDNLQFGADPQPAAIRLSPGEYEDLQFVVAFDKSDDVMGLDVAVSPLTNAQGQTLGPVQLREALYLTTDTPSGFLGFPIGQWPDPLFPFGWEKEIPDGPITRANLEVLTDSRKRVLWLIVRADPGAAPGLYRGKAILSLGGKSAGEFAVEAKVNSFALPRRAHLRCSTGMVGWKGLKSNLTILGLPPGQVDAMHQNGMDQYRRLILEYGWTPTMWFGPKEWQEYKDVGRGASVFPCGSRKAQAQAEQWLQDNGLLKYAYTYAPFDEHPNEKVPEVVEWARKWKQESKIPILDCYYGGNVEPLFGLVDVWLGQDPRLPHWGEPTGPLNWGHKALERKKAGDQFFGCNANLIWHVEYVPVEGRSLFWSDFTAGLDGRYVYSTCRWTEDVYKKNWTSGNYMGCVVYPGPGGVTTSIRLETLRDAVEDYDYLTILRDSLEARRRAGEAPKSLAAEAKAVLEDPKLSERVRTVEGLHDAREHIADLIEQLAGGK
jgi:hypothetical protein